MIGRRLLLAIVVTFLAACGGGASTGSPGLGPVATSTASARPSPTSSATTVAYRGVFTPTASMTTSRNGHTATLLPNGLVLIAGGQKYDGAALASAEVYDPAVGTFKLTGSMDAARTMHTATLLLDGRVLIAGGGKTVPSPVPEAPSIMGLSCCEPVTSAELYDPATGTFTRGGNMTASRYPGLTATVLKDGRVLFAGGHSVLADGSMGDAVASAELFDPASATFRATGSMRLARFGHSATLLQNGEVLIAGGQAGPQGSNSMSAELYNPASGTFRPTGNLLGNGDAFHTATLLGNGQVLVVGEGGGDNTSHPEVYVPEMPGSGQSGAFGPTSTTAGRFSPSATLLADGRVLVAGGTLGGNLASAVLFDPVTQAFAATGSLSVARHGQTATLLTDGRVLIAGGTDDADNPIDSAELFH